MNGTGRVMVVGWRGKAIPAAASPALKESRRQANLPYTAQRSPDEGFNKFIEMGRSKHFSEDWRRDACHRLQLRHRRFPAFHLFQSLLGHFQGHILVTVYHFDLTAAITKSDGPVNGLVVGWRWRLLPPSLAWSPRREPLNRHLLPEGTQHRSHHGTSLGGTLPPWPAALEVSLSSFPLPDSLPPARYSRNADGVLPRPRSRLPSPPRLPLLHVPPEQQLRHRPRPR